MKTLVRVLAISVVVMISVLPLAYGQQQPAPRTQADRIFEGQLVKVDANAKSISVKGTGDKEMMFYYTDTTEVVGPEKNIQGLAGKTGAELKVTYREASGRNTATKIETIQKR